MRDSCRFIGLLLGAMLVLTGGSALAADPQQALLKAQGLLKQVAQQKAAAEAELAKLRGELAGKERTLTRLEEETRTQSATLAEREAGLARATAQGEALSARLAKTETRLEQTTAKLREVAGMYKDTRRELAETVAARDTLTAELAAVRKELADAEKKNRALYEVNAELLAEYRGKSAWDALRQAEPFSGIDGVAVENRIQDYEDRMAEQLRDVNVEAAER
ncbi:MAG: hypothetical protein AB7Q76_16855 [Gammaproteobacteria bacterium]